MSAVSPSFSNKPDHLPIKTSLTLSQLSLAHSSVKKKPNGHNMNASDQWGAIFRTFSSQSQSEYGSLSIKGFICLRTFTPKELLWWMLIILHIQYNDKPYECDSQLSKDRLSFDFIPSLVSSFFFFPSSNFTRLKVNNHSSTQFRHQF